MARDPDHPQVRIEWKDRVATVDEGIADDVMVLWRRFIPTFASCQGEPDGSRRYIACGAVLTVARAHVIGETLGWVDHIVWPASQAATCFYAANTLAVDLDRVDRVLLLPRRGF